MFTTEYFKRRALISQFICDHAPVTDYASQRLALALLMGQVVYGVHRPLSFRERLKKAYRVLFEKTEEIPVRPI